MTEQRETLIPFQSLHVLIMSNVTESDIESLFRYDLPEDYPRILFENGFATIYCRNHRTAYNLKNIYGDLYTIDWALEEGQRLDPTTIPVEEYETQQRQTVREEQEVQDEEEYDEYDEEEHPDMCQQCHRDYVDYRGRCEYCRDMNPCLFKRY